MSDIMHEELKKELNTAVRHLVFLCRFVESNLLWHKVGNTAIYEWYHAHKSTPADKEA